MANDVEMGGWSELLHTSTKLVEQASPSAHFPTLQRSLDQLETLSTKLKAKTLRAEAPSQSISATRLLAREGINAEQLARDLKSFELKTTFEDAFPSEATSVEEYLQQLHEMTIASSIQEAQKDNLRSFNKHIMQVLQDDWQKEKRDFLQSLSRISPLPRRGSSIGSGAYITRPALMSSLPHQQSVGPASLALLPVDEKSITEKKALVYAECVRDLNEARSRKLVFKSASKFRAVYESLGADVAGGRSVTIHKMWHLIEALVGENSMSRNISRKMCLVIGARKHLESYHEKYITEKIQANPSLAALGGSVGNLNKIRAFLRVFLRDVGVLDFDVTEMRGRPPNDTTWQQIYYCLRSGFYEDAKRVAQSSNTSRQFAPLLIEWISTGGNVSTNTSISASEECEKMLKLSDRSGRPSFDRKKLILYSIISGSKSITEKVTTTIPNLFTTIEDFLWFKLSSIRDIRSESQLPFAPYTLTDLQTYLNNYEPGYYTKKGKDPLAYPYLLLLSVQFLEAVLYLSKEGEEGFSIDGVHMAIALADQGVLLEGSGSSQRNFSGVLMDACAEVAGIVKQYGSVYLRNGNLELALEYYVQAASAIGGGEKCLTEFASIDEQRKRNSMLKQLLTEILLRDGGINLLLGLRGTGEEAELAKYLTDLRSRQGFLVEAARHCHEAGLYDKAVEIHKRVGAFGLALEIINKCLSDAICALARGKIESDSQAVSLVRAGEDVLETSRSFPQSSAQEKDLMQEHQKVLRQLSAIYYIHKLFRNGNHLEAIREIVKLQFLPLDPRSPNVSTDVIKTLNQFVQACVPDLIRVCLTCLENVRDTDGSLRALKSKIGSIVANSTSRNWPQDLYEKFARSI